MRGKGKFFQYLIGLAAIALAGSAAYFSVFGLSKLFAGASLYVIIMASSLEFGKIMAASFLYRYWSKINQAVRSYFLAGVIGLMLITSLGIYGFLSSAYQTTASKSETVETEIGLLETKKTNLVQQRDQYNVEKEELIKGVTELRSGLAGNKVQYKDKETGQIITTTSAENRKAFEKQLDNSLERQDVINKKLDEINDQIFDLETKIVESKTDENSKTELGPLKYLSTLLNIPMNKVVNWFILLIIFVFDPMAIMLIIAFNQIQMGIQERYKPKEEETQTEVTVEKFDSKRKDNLNKIFNDLFKKKDEQEEVKEPEKIKEESAIKEEVKEIKEEPEKIIEETKKEEKSEEVEIKEPEEVKKPDGMKPVKKKIIEPGMKPDGRITI